MNKKMRGQGMIEYALIIALIAVALVLSLKLFGISMYDVYCGIADKVSGGSACSAKAEYVCQDDFSATLNDWTLWQGSTSTDSIKKGEFCPPSYNLMLNKCSMSKKIANYTVNLNGAELKSGNGYGVMFRMQNPPTGLTGYAFQYDPGLNGFVIRQWSHGVEINPPLAYKRMPGYDWYDDEHDIQVKVQGDTFTGYIDGVPVLTARDSTYTEGGVGLRTWDSTKACFEDFSIK